ncbi:hypothetical protein KBB96_04870 [Luteolibacter ambystomatis]|uniref:Uncharacterized protein n=1 Tax=Luteolibacter ambystomatis TaxID=2824561 RepID=A0A975PG14_9BACT|nr:hypothetical protein [Luteolibacter ambystomatis]QUE52225.1 hypothetical protein KBB96_04870 [Luteolibacter ambystomatis]
MTSDFEEIERQKSRSPIHNPARDALALELKKMIGAKISWAIPGGEFSDFPLVGNLMESVEEVETEYEVQTPFGRSYRFDIALLGPALPNSRIILGAIELENQHEFESSKCLLCKCLGFPLVSLDLESLSADELTGEVLLRRVTETTVTSDDGRRRNYFYLHTFLYPAYLQYPHTLGLDQRHQFVIFASDKRIGPIIRYLNKLQEFLGIGENAIVLQPCSWSDDPRIKEQFENEGSIAGHDWRSYSEQSYLRITMDRPPASEPRIRVFHLAMAKLLNSDRPALVGYKVERGKHNRFREDPFWEKEHFPDGELARRCRIAPKHLSEPIDSILRAVESIGQRRFPA